VNAKKKMPNVGIHKDLARLSTSIEYPKHNESVERLNRSELNILDQRDKKNIHKKLLQN